MNTTQATTTPNYSALVYTTTGTKVRKVMCLGHLSTMRHDLVNKNATSLVRKPCDFCQELKRQQINADIAADEAYRTFQFERAVAARDALYSGRFIQASPAEYIAEYAGEMAADARAIEEDERILDARLVQAAERDEVVRVARFKARREDAPQYRRSRWSRPDDDELESAAY